MEEAEGRVFVSKEGEEQAREEEEGARRKRRWTRTKRRKAFYCTTVAQFILSCVIQYCKKQSQKTNIQKNNH